ATPAQTPAMRFTVTPLGSAGGRTVGQVVGDIVRYLEPRTPNALSIAPAVPGGDGPTSYYADRGTEAGRWLGYGATEAGLTGEVVTTDFARVLSGRDPGPGHGSPPPRAPRAGEKH
ncbi:MAG: relaxase domain-containing protein, partial [Pseudonocardiaceae bacterium]